MSATPPLGDLRVLDVSTFVGAPFAAACLAEFGAEVLKIERPGVGDSLRQLGTPSQTGDSYFWLSEARNKKCITLDLKQAKGAELFRRMVVKADVVIENFRPGTLEKWGLGFSDLIAVSPGLIMLRLSAYGEIGPKNQLPGFARIAQAYAGLSYLVGTPETPPLVAGSTTLADYVSGLYGAYGILIALRARDRNGRGQYIDIGLHDGIFRFLDEIASVYDRDGTVRERMGTEAPNSAPHSHYPSRDGKWVAIACTNDRMFERLAIVMAQPDLAGPDRYGRLSNRLAEREQVNQIVSTWTSKRTRQEVIELWRRRGSAVWSGQQYCRDFPGRAILAEGNADSGGGRTNWWSSSSGCRSPLVRDPRKDSAPGPWDWRGQRRSLSGLAGPGRERSD